MEASMSHPSRFARPFLALPVLASLAVFAAGCGEDQLGDCDTGGEAVVTEVTQAACDDLNGTFIPYAASLLGPQ